MAPTKCCTARCPICNVASAKHLQETESVCKRIRTVYGIVHSDFTISVLIWLCFACAADPVDPEMEPDTAQQDTQEPSQEQEEEDEADPVMLAKKQKQLAKRGVTFEAKVDPKVNCRINCC